MFNSLTEKLQSALLKLRGQATMSESNIAGAMDEIKNALIDADVNFEIANEFVETVKHDCLGEKVIRSVTPGQMAIKIVYDKLVELMGTGEVELLSGAKPNVIMMVGLHGSGKTTTSAKLARYLKAKQKKVLLVAADVYRPAAIDQLEVLGREIDVQVYSSRDTKNVPALAANALEIAKAQSVDYVIIDTAGRLEIDEDMVNELVQVSDITHAAEKLLVVDAALGQQAVSVARHFHEKLNLSGVVLTKLDGDSRGGAALTVRKVTGCPIKFTGIGEKLEDLDVFYPDRMASRIIGMGDVISLVEKASEQIDKEEAEKLEAKLKKNKFDFNDFLSQLRQMSKLGGIESILKFLPGGEKLASMPEFDAKQFKNMESIICSMNKEERANADIIDMSRRKRIAKGSGRKLEEVSQLIKQFSMMKKMMKNSGLVNQILAGGSKNRNVLPSMFNAARIRGGGGRGSNYTPPKKKRK